MIIESKGNSNDWKNGLLYLIWLLGKNFEKVDLGVIWNKEVNKNEVIVLK